MSDDQFTRNDLELILDSLEFTKRNFEEYDGYPSYEFKQNRVAEVDNVIMKVRTLLNEDVFSK